MKQSFERKVAILSIVFAGLHFVAETLWHFKFGQFLPMLIVDYIAVSLLLYGGFQTLKSNSAIGLLCGAWGFEFCLNYRALFNRVDKLLSGIGNGNHAIGTTAYILAVLLIVSISMFLMTMYLTNRNAKNT
jgi:hypothetical protein